MYVPLSNTMADRAEQIAFMNRYSFATIVTISKDIPIATHLPFLVKERDGNLILQAHFAKANMQWEHIAEKESLVIFSQPHAYVSPKHYEKELSVPTWNYLAVHVYGTPRILTDENEIEKHLDDLVLTYEEDYKNKWDKFPQEFKSSLTKGIVAFEILVSRLEGKKKLSQNKNKGERENIIGELQNSNDKNERDLATYMLDEKYAKSEDGQQAIISKFCANGYLPDADNTSGANPRGESA